jgi:outer membrane lipoprotein carrier protein
MTALVRYCLLALAVAAAETSPELSVEELVRRVQARFDATSDFTADVEQELILVGGGRTLKARGTVAFKRPGKMRWTLRNEEEQLIVADGATLWVYQPEESQVLKAPFPHAFRSSSPISFLTGVGRIEDDFAASLDGTEDSHVFIMLVPRRDEGEIGRLRLRVDRRSYEIIGAEVRDPLGNLTKLLFSNLRRNTDLADGLFRFDVPDGVDVIEAPIGY